MAKAKREDYHFSAILRLDGLSEREMNKVAKVFAETDPALEIKIDDKLTVTGTVLTALRS